MLRAVAKNASTEIQVLAKSAVAVSGAADTNENTLATITIPAGAMGPNGHLRIRALFSFTNNGNNKTMRVRLGGAAGTAFAAVTRSSSLYSDIDLQIANRNAADSQIGYPYFELTSGTIGVPSGALTTGTIDTSAATTLVLTGQKATAGDTLTLESYLVELMYGA